MRKPTDEEQERMLNVALRHLKPDGSSRRIPLPVRIDDLIDQPKFDGSPEKTVRSVEYRMEIWKQSYGRDDPHPERIAVVLADGSPIWTERHGYVPEERREKFFGASAL